MPTENITRTYRRGSGGIAITGAEAITVENGQSPDQQIDASTEEAVALGAFKDHQLKSLTLICDQAAECQFLGVRYAILDLNVVGPDTITFTGDLEQEFELTGGDLVRIEGTVADNGLYLVTLVAEAVGVTTLTIGDGVPWPVGGGGAVGTFARVASLQRMGYSYDIATATLATGILTIAGDVSDIFAAGDEIIIINSTGNDGYYVLGAVATDGPPVTTTSLTVVAGALADNTNDGDLFKVRQAFKLAANIPFLWTYESGLQNPFISPELTNVFAGMSPLFNEFRGDVENLMVNNLAAVVANFDARIGIDAIIY